MDIYKLGFLASQLAALIFLAFRILLYNRDLSISIARQKKLQAEKSSAQEEDGKLTDAKIVNGKEQPDSAGMTRDQIRLCI